MRAIIVKKQPTNEQDLLVTCYTQERGRLTAIAKSSLKPTSTQAMHLDLFNVVEFELIDGRSYPIIASAQSERVHAHVKASPLLTAMAGFFAEIVDRLVFDNERDDELWNVLSSALEALDATSDQPIAFATFRQKQFELLDVLGYAPQTSGCVVCGASPAREGWLLSSEHGGLVCMECVSKGYYGIIMSKQDIALLHGDTESHGPTRSALDALFEHLASASLASLGLIYRLASQSTPVL